MAFQVSNYLKQRIAQSLCGGVDLTKATSFTMKLFTDNVSLEGVGTELTTPEYEQFTFTNNLTNFPALTGGTAVNDFTDQSADTFSEDAPYQSIGIFDQSGNLWFREINLSRTILLGQFQQIEVGDLVFEVVWDNALLEPSNYLKEMLIQELVGGVDLTKAESFVTKLFSDDVDLDGDGTELVIAEYEQFTFDNDLTSFPARTDGKSILDLSFESADVFSADTDFDSIGVFDEEDNLWFRKVFATATIFDGQKQVLSSFQISIS